MIQLLDCHLTLSDIAMLKSIPSRVHFTYKYNCDILEYILHINITVMCARAIKFDSTNQRLYLSRASQISAEKLYCILKFDEYDICY